MSDDGPPIIMCTTEPPLVEPPKLSFGHALKSAPVRVIRARADLTTKREREGH